MALYLGDSRELQINLNGQLYCLNLFSKAIIINNVMLLSYDNYRLKDSSGIILTVKEDE